MPYPLTEQNIHDLNNDVLPAFTRMSIGNHLGGIGQNPSGGADFFVDGNKSLDTGDGLSWATAKKLLASAITLARTYESTDVNRAWAKRARIHCTGDFMTEDLTILPKKCDIIGHGTKDGFPRAGLEGNHSGFAVAAGGCRFYNMHFMAPAGGGDIFTFPTGGFNANTEFHGCSFSAESTAKAGGAILGTNIDFLVIEGCWFSGGFSDAVIEIAAGTARYLQIRNNDINGNNAGIELNASATCTPEVGIIDGNVIHTATECINDGSDKFVITRNMCHTEQAKGSAGAGAIVGNEFLGTGNKIAASDLANADWPALGTL